MLRVLSELLWVLRRERIPISTAQSIVAARAVRLVGWSDREALAIALEGTLITRARDRAIFRAAFDDFFRPDRGHAGDLFDRLRGRGFSDSEIDLVRDLLAGAAQRSGDAGDATAALVGTSYDLDWLMRGARMARTLGRLSSPRMAGFFAQRASTALKVREASDLIQRLGSVLRDGMGDERAEAIAAALREELDALRRRIRQLVHDTVAPTEPDRPRSSSPLDSPFVSLDADGMREAERAMRRLAEKLRGKVLVRTRRAKRGRIDVRRTAREAARTGGVPLRLYFRKARRRPPKLVLLCDLSDSVRAASRFLLQLVAAASSVFEAPRSFVFVAELVETTELFSRARTSRDALKRLTSGAVIELTASSHYERALLQAEKTLTPHLDRRTTLVILGDGRTNHKPDGAEALGRMRKRVNAVVWICPESSEQWGLGDSRMNRYREVCTTVLSARTPRELEEAARSLVRLR